MARGHLQDARADLAYCSPLLDIAFPARDDELRALAWAVHQSVVQDQLKLGRHGRVPSEGIGEDDAEVYAVVPCRVVPPVAERRIWTTQLAT